MCCRCAPSLLRHLCFACRRYSYLTLRGWSERCTPASHATAKLLALLGCHLLPAVFHALFPTIAAGSAMAGEAAKENLAEKKQTQTLPKRDRVPSEDRRHKSVP